MLSRKTVLFLHGERGQKLISKRRTCQNKATRSTFRNRRDPERMPLFGCGNIHKPSFALYSILCNLRWFREQVQKGAERRSSSPVSQDLLLSEVAKGYTLWGFNGGKATFGFVWRLGVTWFVREGTNVATIRCVRVFIPFLHSQSFLATWEIWAVGGFTCCFVLKVVWDALEMVWLDSKSDRTTKYALHRCLSWLLRMLLDLRIGKKECRS